MSQLAPQPDLAPHLHHTCRTVLVEQWTAVEDSARVVAMLAGRNAPEHDIHAELRIGMLAQTQASQSQDAILALGELVATMRVGLDALLGAHGSAADPQIPAARLWSEYERGRAKVLFEAAAALACQPWQA